MSSDLAIRVSNVSKRYRIGLKKKPHGLLSQQLAGMLLEPFHRLRRIGKPPSPEATIWALKDVNFEVNAGEVIGIIGRNGAGKSTLLKIMSRVTEPTEGRIETWGRMGSLLEVGTGFHPELSGRENVYLNGAILGMRRKEIDRKFDEIVSFAGIDKFLDTPVKHYSSGMYVRLAFSVAAHLEPQILLVDEVLAVGDVEFQKKCLGKMESVVSEGRTILFVSHQLNSIRKLCSRCVWLDDGKVRMEGPTAHVVSSYESAWLTRSKEEVIAAEQQKNVSHFTGWEILEGRGEESNWLSTTGPLKVKFTAWVHKRITSGLQGIALWDDDGQLMWGSSVNNLKLDKGLHEFVYDLPELPLRPGLYHWQLSLWDGNEILDNWFAIPSMMIATSPLAHQSREWAGVLNVPCEVKINSVG